MVSQAVTATGTELALRLRSLRGLSEGERTGLLEAAARWGGAHVYQHPAFVLAAAHAGRQAPMAMELRSEDGALRGFWLAYGFDRPARGPLRLSVVWARGRPVLAPELQGDVEVQRRLVETLLAASRQPSRLAVMVTTEPEADPELDSVLRELGFCRQDLSSFVVGLAKSEEELWSGLSKSARYSVKLAQRSKAVLEERQAAEDFEMLATLVNRTYEAGGVSYRLSIEEFRAYRELARQGGGRLSLALVQGEVAGATFEVILGDRSLTHLWSTSELGRRLGIGDFMVWETMRRCRAGGLRWLDLGTVKTNPEPGTKSAGIYQFKAKWGGRLLATPFYRYSNPLDRLVNLLRRLRQRWRAT